LPLLSFLTNPTGGTSIPHSFYSPSFSFPSPILGTKWQRNGGINSNYELFPLRLQMPTMFTLLKAKAVPLHATKALEWRGGITPTHSRPRH
jgi:hypothetical protein